MGIVGAGPGTHEHGRPPDAEGGAALRYKPHRSLKLPFNAIPFTDVSVHARVAVEKRLPALGWADTTVQGCPRAMQTEQARAWTLALVLGLTRPAGAASIGIPTADGHR